MRNAITEGMRSERKSRKSIRFLGCLYPISISLPLLSAQDDHENSPFFNRYNLSNLLTGNT